MQYELIRFKNELGITFIYVTHDQEEALTMSDTIVVMNQGYIQQVGTRKIFYNEPKNAFVADFIGDSNILVLPRWYMTGSSISSAPTFRVSMKDSVRKSLLMQ